MLEEWGIRFSGRSWGLCRFWTILGTFQSFWIIVEELMQFGCLCGICGFLRVVIFLNNTYRVPIFLGMIETVFLAKWWICLMITGEFWGEDGVTLGWLVSIDDILGSFTCKNHQIKIYPLVH